MVKIKDFTLASKNLGKGARAPQFLHYSRLCSPDPLCYSVACRSDDLIDLKIILTFVDYKNQ